MAKLSPGEITPDDLQEYLDGYSDFGFEQQVLKQLVAARFDCEHGGSYVDPVAGKIRQFDIRAARPFGRFTIRMAVECKNLRPNYPLLVLQTPRECSEAFQEVLISSASVDVAGGADAQVMRVDSRLLYRPQSPVGKDCAQVGRATPPPKSEEPGPVSASDSEVYEKWSQALGAAADLVNLAAEDAKSHKSGVVVSLVIPAVILPDGRLFAADYSVNGELREGPRQVDRVSFYVGRDYPVPGAGRFTISHLEFFTQGGLASWIAETFCSEHAVAQAVGYSQVEATIQGLIQ